MIICNLHLHFTLLSITFLIANQIHSSESRLVLTKGDQTLEVPTFDYFELDTPSYVVIGRLLLPNFSTDAVCQLNISTPVTIPPDRLIVGCLWKEAEKAGCETISHVCDKRTNVTVLLIQHIIGISSSGSL
jgi:hypothetical protein